MGDEVELVKDKINIVELVSEYVPLKRMGRSYRGLCPFHKEKTPSFYVSPERQTWHCFGCSRGGDAFSFLMEKESLEFGEALRILAKRVGVELKERNASVEKQQYKERLMEAVSLSSRLYQHVLQKQNFAQKAREYLLKRGVKEKMTEEFELGYAPLSWQTTGDFLQKKGFTSQQLEQAGLLVSKETKRLDQRSWYDRFRGRLIFPVKDLYGRSLGFTARTLGQDEPKYLNSPDSVLFQKGKLLYRLDLAKEAIRQNNEAILVEGSLDVISCYQTGFENVVAPLGSALTLDHLRLLKRFTDKLILAFDQDEGGLGASLRAIPLAQEQDFEVKVASWEKFKDPDELVQKEPLQFAKALKNASPAFDFFFDYASQKASPADLQGKRRVVEIMAPFLLATVNAVSFDAFIKELAQRLRVEEKSVLTEIERLRKKQSQAFQPTDLKTKEDLPPVAKKLSRGQLLGENLLALFIGLPEEFKQEKEVKNRIIKINSVSLEDDDHQQIFENIIKALATGINWQIDDLKKDLSLSQQEMVERFFLEKTQEFTNLALYLTELDKSINELKKNYRQRKIAEWQSKMLEAERKKDLETVEQLKEEVRRLLAEI